MDSPAYSEFVKQYKTFAGMNGFGASYQHAIESDWNCYIPDKDRRSLSDASPLCAEKVDEVARALIIIGEHDILRAESEAYARRLRDAAVPVTLLMYRGQIHGFYLLLGVMDDARNAINASGAALREAFLRR